ncbi:MAG: DegT/DnrJ/EryC1/StrS family aminotransferase [bacterium]|nr:DegT/DnrJ/EryC1/StrS family aminotransferase [bacterium]
MLKHNIPWANESLLKGVEVAFKTKNITTGKFIRKFEKSLAKYTGIRYVVATSSGFTAIVVALLNFKKEHGKVIIPSYTCASVIQAIRFAGFKPIILDVSPYTLSYEVKDIKKYIKKIDSIILVDQFGMVNHPLELIQFKPKIIQDGATSIGHSKFGMFGNIATTSFYVTKTLGFGEGGAIFVRNKKIYENTLDMINPDKKEANTLKLNAKITDFEAIIGINALKKLNDVISKKRSLAKIYIDNLDKRIKIITSDINSTFNRFVIQVKNADKLIKKLKAYDIEAKKPINYIPKGFKNAEYLYSTLVSLPMHVFLTTEDIKKICNIINLHL